MSTFLRRTFRVAAVCLVLAAPRLYGQPPLSSPQHARDVVHRLEGGSPTRILIDCDGPWQVSSDGESWSTISIPAAFEEHGKFQLRKSFTLTPQQRNGAMWTFAALGINYQCDVLVNDQFVTHHVGGYTSCTIPIPDYALRDGENVIKLVGSNELGARETAPTTGTTFSPRNYGGLYRSVAIVGMPTIAITDVDAHIAAVPDHAAEVTARIQVTAGHLHRTANADTAVHTAQEPTANITLRAEILDGNGLPTGGAVSTQLTVTDSRAQTVRMSLSIPNPRWWSTATPALYTLRCTVIRDTAASDVFSIPIGVRTFETQGNGVLMNGAPFEIKGVVYHEDLPPVGSAMDYAALEIDMQSIKMLGANALRLEHPASPLLLTLCDEYGLLVFEQVPAIGIPAAIVNTANYISLCKNYLQALVQRDRNHPCVVAWGLGSGIDAARSGDYVEQLTAFSATLDGRPTYYTSPWRTVTARGAGMVFLDVFGLDAAEVAARVHAWRIQNPNVPLIVSSYGKIIRPDNHNGYSDPLSVEAQARYLLTCFNALHQEQAAGGFMCSFADWRSDRPSILSVESNPYVNYAGLVSYNRDERRLSYDVAKALYTNDKIPTIIVGEDPATAPVIYIIVGLVFLLLLVYLANNSRRFRENFSRAIFRPFNFFADIRDQRILSTVQTTMLGVITAGTFAIFFSSIAYYLRTSPGFDALLNALIAGNVLKYRVAQMVWNPLECVIVLTLVFFTALAMLTAVIRFCAIFVRPRIFFGDAYTIVLWAALPTIIMIPISMILYRVMMFGPYVITAVLLGFLVMLWIGFRMLRGTAVVFDVPFRRIYTVALGVAAACAIAAIYWYDSRTALLAHVQMLYHQLMS